MFFSSIHKDMLHKKELIVLSEKVFERVYLAIGATRLIKIEGGGAYTLGERAKDCLLDHKLTIVGKRKVLELI